jgi:glycerate dehydrogenase
LDCSRNAVWSNLPTLGFGTPSMKTMDVLIAERQDAGIPRVDRVAFHEVLQRSDMLAVLCPLTAETHGLIGAEELALMKRNALVINCARGGIVDEFALAVALAEGRIGGAGIDSLENEPPSLDNSLLRMI